MGSHGFKKWIGVLALGWLAQSCSPPQADFTYDARTGKLAEASSATQPFGSAQLPDGAFGRPAAVKVGQVEDGELATVQQVAGIASEHVVGAVRVDTSDLDGKDLNNPSAPLKVCLPVSSSTNPDSYTVNVLDDVTGQVTQVPPQDVYAENGQICVNTLTANGAVVLSTNPNGPGQAVDPASIKLQLIAPANAIARAGEQTTLTLQATSAGQVVTDYQKAVSISFVGPGTLSEQVLIFAAADNGVKSLTQTFTVPGSYVLKASDGIVETLTTIQVIHGPAAVVEVSDHESSVKLSKSTSMTITVRDAAGNVVTDYQGTVAFGTPAVVSEPKVWTFTAEDLGIKSITLVFTSAGSFDLAFADQADAAVNNAAQDESIFVTALPIAVLSNTPSASSKENLLAVVVGGDNVIAYRHKLVSASSQCSEQTGYGAETSVSIAISDDLSGLSDGPLVLCVQGKDGSDAWQDSEHSTTHAWVLDRTAPDLTYTSGSFVSGVHAASFAVAGACSETGAVAVELGGLTSGTLCDGSSWSTTMDLSGLSDGALSLSVTNTDAAGNVSSIAQVLTKDIVAPTLSGLANDAVTTNSKTFNWSCNETCEVRTLVDQTPTSSPSGSYATATSLTHTAGDGTQYLHIQARDAAGNETAVEHYSFEMDTTPPTAPAGWLLTSPSSSPSGIPRPSFSGTGTDADTARIFEDAGCTTEIASGVVSAGSFSATRTTGYANDGSENGVKAYYGTMTDPIGNVTACTDLSLGYTYDHSLVSLSISTPAAVAVIDSAGHTAVTVSGGCTLEATAVDLNWPGDGANPGATVNCTSSTWSINVDLTAGTVSQGLVTFSATHAGAPTATRNIVYDSSAWTLSSPANGATSTDNTPQLQKANLADLNGGGSVAIYEDSGCATQIGGFTFSTDPETATVSNISLATNGTADGTRNFYIQYTDPGSTVSPDCVDLGVSYTLDTQGPSWSPTINPTTTSYISADSHVPSWTGGAATDDHTVSYHAKICTNNDCATGCSGETVVDGSTTTVSGFALGGNAYYICVDARDSLGQASGFTASAATVSRYGALDHFAVTGIAASPVAGSQQTITVEAQDSSNVRVANYTGTITFSEDDPHGSAVVPADYTFVGGDNGIHTFTNGVTLISAGARVVSVADGGITGNHAAVTVTHAALDHFDVAGITDPIVAGTTSSLTVTAEDTYGNPVLDYTGTITFSTDNLKADLPADYDFSGAGGDGVHTFTLAGDGAVAFAVPGEYFVRVDEDGVDGDNVGGGQNGSQTAITVQGHLSGGWNWVKGSDTHSSAGSYGTINTTASSNEPPSRTRGSLSKDASDNLWLFGGISGASSYNDLWRFDGTDWTWVKGDNTANNNGVIGTQHVAATGNKPGSRQRLNGLWFDRNGHLNLFGSFGRATAGGEVELDDFWRYNGTDWIFMDGVSGGVGGAGTYGTKGTISASSYPARVNWTNFSATTNDGSVWLHGGATTGAYNALWRYDGSQWTWISGANTADGSGTYGTKGQSNPANVPGARSKGAGIADDADRLLLFGGFGRDTGVTDGSLNDLWIYDGADWTWYAGSNSIDQLGDYGTKGTAAAARIPGGRERAAIWRDQAGNIWAFGGQVFDTTVKRHSDLWKFDGTNWAWVAGPSAAETAGVYGTKGSSRVANTPGARSSNVNRLEADASGRLWLFGGTGHDSANAVGSLNDLWSFTPYARITLGDGSTYFGELSNRVSAATATKTLTIHNNSGFTFSGCSAPSTSDGTNYSISADTCGTNTLNNGATCTFQVTADPTTAGFIDTTVTRSCTVGGTVSAWLTVKGQADLVVEAAYPNNGSDWNDYVKNDGANVYAATDTACDGTEAGYYGSACVHGGEKRKVVVHGTASCAGLSIADNLGAFDWTCVDTSGTATFYTVGLKPGKYLSDLVDGTVIKWQDNFVTVSGSAAGTSTAAQWWDNRVTLAPDNSATAARALDQTGTIYLIEGNRSSNGYNLDADKIGFVVMPGFTLTYGGSATNNCAGDGEMAAADRICLVSTGNQNFLWLEGSYDGDGSGGGGTDAGRGLALEQLESSRIVNVTVLNVTDAAIALDTTNSSLDNIEIRSAASYGIDTSNNANDNTLNDLRISNSGQCINLKGDNGRWTGFHLSNCTDKGVILRGDNNVVASGIIANVTNNGIQINSTSTGNGLQDIKILGAGKGIVFSNNASNNALSRISVINSSPAIEQNAATVDRITVHNLMAINNDQAFLLSAGDHFTAVHVASASNSVAPITASGADNNKFSGNLLLGSGTCTVSAGTNPGLDASCDPVNASNHTKATTSLNLSASILGKVFHADTQNTSDTDGSASFPGSVNTFDWFNSDKPYLRAWGKDGSFFPNADNKNEWTAGTGRLWDLSLASNDAQILNRTGTGTSSNNAFVNASTCPAEVHGNQVAVDQHSTPNTFLLNASEIITDTTGDNDGLCESNEACIYSPNFGAYQGHGDYLTQTCTFQNGTVTGVTMYAYPNNGYTHPALAHDLTAGADSFGPGNGDDTFTDSGNEYDATDVLDGGVGTDTLILATDGAVLDNQITNIENITVSDIAAPITVTITDATGITTVDASGVSGDAVTIDAFEHTSALTISGGDSTDTLDGGKAADVLNGNDGNDTLIGGYNGDTLNGGNGDDTLIPDGDQFSHTTYSAMQLWLDAGLVHGFDKTVANSTAISTWNDLSGMSRTMSAAGGAEPTYVRTGMAGRPELDFDGTEGLFGMEFDHSGGLSLFVVTGDASGAGSRVALGNWNSTGNIRKWVLGKDTTNHWYSQTSPDGSATNAAMLDSAGLIDAIVYLSEDGSSAMRFDRNLNVVDQQTFGLFDGTQANVLTVGGPNPSSLDYIGDISEVIAYSRSLSKRERERVHEYLSFKYSLALSTWTLAADTLTGGAGADTFKFTNASHSSTANPDRITDFVSGTDKIDLTGFDETFHVLGLNAAFSASGRTEVIWELDGSSNMELKIDWGGDGTEDFVIQLDSPNNTLVGTDILFKNAVGTDTIDVIAGGDADGSNLEGGFDADTLVGGDGPDRIYADGKGFTSETVADLAIWLNAADHHTSSGTVGNSGTPATVWADRSGNGNNFDHIDAYPPLFQSSSINGRAAMDFGSGTMARKLEVSSSVTTPADATVFALARLYGSAGIGQIYNDGQSPQVKLYQNNNQLLGAIYNATNESVASSTTTTGGTTVLGSYLYNNTSNVARLYVNGTQEGGDQTATTVRAASIDPAVGGHPNVSNDSHLNGAIGDVLMFNRALSRTEMVTVEKYLSYKYAHTSNGLLFGTDTLTGGAGADQFIWTNTSHTGTGSGNRDVITDFSGESGQGDVIVLDLPGPTAFRSGGNGTSDLLQNHGQHQVAYGQSGGNTQVYIDSTGDGSSNYELQLTGLHALTKDDFSDYHVTNGLVFHLDAAQAFNNKPHASGCTNSLTWKDLSPAGAIGALESFDICDATNGWAGNGSVATPYVLSYDYDGFVNFGDNDAWSFTDGAGNDKPFSIEMWFKPVDCATNLCRLLSKHDSAATAEYNTRVQTDGTAIWQVKSADGANTINVTSNVTFTDGNWYHYVLTYDGSEANTGLRLYQNGTRDAAASLGSAGTYTGMSNTTSYLALGNVNSSGGENDSQVAVVRMYNRVLSQSEIQKNCHAEELRFTAARGDICPDMTTTVALTGGADTPTTNPGTNVITSGTGTYSTGDTIDGGAGHDILVFNGDISGGVSIENNVTNIEYIEIQDNDTNAAITLGDNASSVDNIDASAVDGHAVTINAFEYEEGLVIDGGAAGNTIEGGKRDDVITGGAGVDTLYGNYGDDTIVGGNGDDHIYADSASFDPKSVSSMSIWFKPGADGGAHVTSSDKVMDVIDLAGNGISLSQNTDANRPTLLRNRLSGRGVMEFGGSHELVSPGNITGSDLASSNQVSVFAVSQVDVVADQYLFHWSGGTGGLMLTDYWSDNQTYFRHQDANTTNGEITNAGIYNTHGLNWKVVSAWRQTDSNSYLVANGVQRHTNSTLSDTFDTADTDPFVFGSGGGANYFDGEFAELLVYKTVPTDVQRQRIQEYLMFHYGQAHANHPYGAGDLLTGGGGADRFYWTNASYSSTTNPDRITDFTSGTDFIDLSAFDETFYVLGSGGTFTSTGRTELLWEDDGSSNTHIKIDWGGDGTADFAIQLDDGFDTILLSDFIFKNAVFTNTADSIVESSSDGNFLIGGYDGDTLVGGSGDDRIVGDARPFTKETISNLGVWFDARNPSATGVFPSTGATVSTWVDLSGNGANGTAVNTPVYALPTINGVARSSIQLVASESDYFTTTFAHDPSDAAGAESIAIYNSGSGTGSGQYIWDQADGTGQGRVHMWTNNTDTSLRSSLGGSTLGVGVTLNEWYLAAQSHVNGSRQMYLSSLTAGATDTVVAEASDGTYALGAGAAGSFRLNGHISEFLSFTKKLSSTERARVFEYLSMKYREDLSGLTSFSTNPVDTLTGGSGKDEFVWTNASHSGTASGARDVIADFVSGTDKIVLGGDGPFLFRGNAEFKSDLGIRQVRFTGSNPAQVEVDENSDGNPDMTIELTGVSNLTAQDFADHYVEDGLVLHLDAQKAYQNQAFANGCTNSKLWRDIGPHGFTGTLHGFSSCGAATGWVGDGSVSDPYRLSMDGTDDYIGFGQPEELDFERTDPFTMEAWIKADYNTVAFDRIMGRYANQRGYVLMWRNTGVPRLMIRNTATTNEINVESSITPTNGRYYHIVATYDGSSTAAGAKLYLNGADVSSIQTDNLSATIKRTTSTFAIGAEYETGVGASLPGDSDILLARVYNRALSANEVQKNCQAEELRYTANRNSLCLDPRYDTNDLLTSGADTPANTTTGDSYVAETGDYSTADTIDGGAGDDALVFIGDYSGGATIQGNVTNVETIEIKDSGSNASITLAAAASGITKIDASTVVGETVTIDAFAYDASGLTIDGGAGNDSLEGGKGADTINGHDGNDTIIGGYNGDTIDAGAGDDVIYPSGTAFTTSTVSGIRAWYDALSRDSSIALNGTDVARWGDISGYGAHMAQTTASDQPAFATNQINGIDTLTFTAADNNSLRSAAPLDAGDDTMSIVAVWRTDVLASQSIWDQQQAASGAGTRAGLLPLAGSDVRFVGQSNDADFAVSYTTATPYISVMSHDNGTVRYYHNGTALSDTINATTQNLTTEGASIGNRYRDELQDFDGDIGEILILDNALGTLTDVQRIQEYLSQKWAIDLSGLTLAQDTITTGTGNDTVMLTPGTYAPNTAPVVVTDFSVGSDKLDFSNFNEIFHLRGAGGTFTSSGRTEIRWIDASGDAVVQIDWGGDGSSDFEVLLQSVTHTTVTTNDFIFTNAVGTNVADTMGASASGSTIAGAYDGDALNGSDGGDTIFVDGKGFSSKTFPNMGLWLDASHTAGDGTTPPSTGTAVSTWYDLSSFGRNATATATPDYRTVAVSGVQRPYVNFDHPSSEYFTTSFAYNPTGTAGQETIVLGYSNGFSGSNQVFISQQDGGGTGRTRLRYDRNDDAIYSITGGSGGGLSAAYATWYLMGESLLTGNRKVFVDDLTTPDDTAVTIDSADGGYVIGASNGFGNELDGRISEVLSFERRLTTAERTEVYEYLSLKWGHNLTGYTSFATNPTDTVTGGSGADEFVWTNAAHSGIGSGNRDIITDFTQGVWGTGDKIVLDAPGPLKFAGTSAFGGSGTREIRYVASSPTVVEVDLTGDGNTNYEIELSGAHTLTAEDFRDHHVTNGLVFHLDPAKAFKGTPNSNGCGNSDLTYQDLSVTKAQGQLRGFTSCGATRGWVGDGTTGDPYALAWDDTAGDRVSFGDVLDSDHTDAFSLAAWVNLAATGNQQIIASKWHGTTTPSGWIFSINPTGNIVFHLANDWVGGNRLTVTGNTVVSTSQWIFVVMTYTGSAAASGVSLYVDGTLIADTDTNDSLSATTVNTLDLTLGARSDADSYEMNGKIGDVFGFDRQLGVQEIIKLCQATELKYSATRSGICAAP